MTAVAMALDALFADDNIAREAVYTPDGGAPALLRVVTRRADDITGFGDARIWSETTRIDLRVAEVPNPPRRPHRDRWRRLPHPGRALPRPGAAGLDRGSAAGMKLKLDVTPDLAALMAAEIKAGERAVTTAMREAGGQLKTDWRRQITRAGLGQRLARSIRAETWPKGTTSIGAASLVWSKAPAIVGAHDTGPLIRSKTGFWLAIPTPAAGRGLRGGRITPGEWERRRGLRLRFVYRRRGPSLLVADRARINKRGQAVASRAKTGRNQVTAPIFLLVPQVKLPKRLDLDRDAVRALDSLPGLIVANWVEGRTT